MTTQQQEHRPDLPQKHRSKRPLWMRWLIASVILLFMVVGIIIWILTSRNTITTILPIVIFTVLGVLIALFQWLFPVSMNTPEHHPTHQHTHEIPPIIVHVPTTQPLHETTPRPEKALYRGIVGLPPPTDPRTIQQREHVVREVYTKLIQPGIAAIALTGIGGVGKSTLAALIYRYVEEQRQTHTSPFLAETLWLIIDPVVTFADLVGNLFEVLGKSLPDLSNLAPQNQAVALFNALNTTDKPRLVIVDQFENLLDLDTGHALTDRPGVGEWLDIINSQQCACRVLLTSRPRPVGTREYPPTYLQEYLVGGLTANEGIALLRNRDVQGSEAELQMAVSHCAGHAFSLTLLASLLHDHHMNLSTLYKNSALWTGDVATNLLDQIYTQRLTDVQRELLLAFSVYREPVPVEAALAIINSPVKTQVSLALKALLAQHLLEAAGEGRYQLHAIIADYAQSRFVENNEQSNEESIHTVHAKAAQYYLQQARMTCLPLEQRRRISDVHDLIEAVWQYCQAESWQEAYVLMQQEEIFNGLKRWGGTAILLELCQMMQPVNKWHPTRTQEAEIYSNLGEIYRVLGQMERAQNFFEQVLSICKEEGDRGRESRLLNSLGRVYNDLAQNEQAREYFEQSLNICIEIGDRVGMGIAINNLGRACNSLGQLERAQKYFEEALRISKEVNGRLEESKALNGLGLVYSKLGQLERAQNFFEQALSIRKELGYRLGEERTLKNISGTYILQGQIELAMKSCEEALRISKDIGDRLGEGMALNNLCLIHVALQKNEQALCYSEEALNVLKEVGDRGSVGMTLNNLGRVCNITDRKKEAFRFYGEALNILREVGDQWGEGEVLHNIGELSFEQRRYNLALACFHLVNGIAKEIQSPLREETQKSIDALHRTMGDEEFTALLAKVEPQAQQIVDQALGESKQFPG